MKRTHLKKLALKTTTIHVLNDDALLRVNGGITYHTQDMNCSRTCTCTYTSIQCATALLICDP